MTRRVTHTRSGIAFPAPEAWEVLGEPAADDVVVLEPEWPGQVFRANLTLTVVDNAGMSFRDWQVATDAALPGMLTDYLLLDLERLEVAGRPGGRRLAHHLSPEGVSLTMEQWFTDVEGTGCTLTATIDSRRYDEQADLFATCARGLLLPGALS